jgi:DNA-directed RNA polymerase specialized sigma24 family protein
VLETYSRDEIRLIIQSLTDASKTAEKTAQKTALNRIARIYAKKTNLGHDDLLQEAYMRVLDGRRAWPRSVEVVPFLAGVMKSVAWDWRVQSHGEEVDPDTVGVEDHSAAAKLELQKLLAIFDDDPIAQKIIIAMMEGSRGGELKEISGLTQTEYETKRTKIRRRLEKLDIE